MQKSNKVLTPNALAFIGLCKEYCIAIANASQTDRDVFVDTMLRLLPRIYMSANDLTVANADMAGDACIDDYLDETTYNDAQESIAALLGEHDTYLDVPEEDMKFSDTPVATSISEGLCDLLQELYNFLQTVRDSTDQTVLEALVAVCDDFKNQWSLILCNVFRALNQVRHSLNNLSDI